MIAMTIPTCSVQRRHHDQLWPVLFRPRKTWHAEGRNYDYLIEASPHGPGADGYDLYFWESGTCDCTSPTWFDSLAGAIEYAQDLEREADE